MDGATVDRRSRPGQSGYELHTVIRGIEFWGYGLDGLSPDDREAASRNWFSEYLDGSGVATCVVSGDLPFIVEKQGEQTNVNPTNPGSPHTLMDAGALPKC